MVKDIVRNSPAIAGVASIIVKNGPGKKVGWVTNGDDHLNIGGVGI